MLRKICTLAFCFFSAFYLFAQENLSLDDAIAGSAMYLTEQIDERTTVAILNYNTPVAKLSGYIIDEMTVHLVNSRDYKTSNRIIWFFGI